MRPRSEEDEALLEALFVQSHAAEFAALQLHEAALQQLLAMQYRGRNMTYAAQYPKASDEVVCVDGVAVGRMTVNRSAEQVRLVDIVLREDQRGRGVGSVLLQRLMQEASAAGVPLRLDVRVGNPAARLYERLGFVATSTDGANLSMEWRAGG